jgi:hypothetical protein
MAPRRDNADRRRPPFASGNSSSRLRRLSSRGSGRLPRSHRNPLARNRITWRTTSDTRNSQRTAVIGFSRAKPARPILAILSPAAQNRLPCPP